jgi:hypothetical protein
MKPIGKREHLPIEIFGFASEDKSKIAHGYRDRKICPFIGTQCTKELYRTTEPPTGSCTVSHLGKPHIICPQRFYEDDFCALWEAIRLAFGSGIEAVLVPEVNLRKEGRKKFGRVDWIGIKLGSDEKIDDFIGIEVMANQTTSTGELTDALKEFNKTGKFSKTHYGYGLNTYMQIKTFFTQCLAKGRIFNKWSKKYVWIMQDVLFEDWTTRFNLKLKEGTDGGNFIFMVQALSYDEKIGRYRLKQEKIYSTTYEQLLEAYAAPVVGAPRVDEFLSTVEARIPKGLRKKIS